VSELVVPDTSLFTQTLALATVLTDPKRFIFASDYPLLYTCKTYPSGAHTFFENLFAI